MYIVPSVVGEEPTLVQALIKHACLSLSLCTTGGIFSRILKLSLKKVNRFTSKVAVFCLLHSLH